MRTPRFVRVVLLAILATLAVSHVAAAAPGRSAASDSRAADATATRLEQQGPPQRGAYATQAQYDTAAATYTVALENAQQGAKLERTRRMFDEVDNASSGRRLINFASKAKIKLTVKTDFEWTRDREGGVANSGGDEVKINIRWMRASVYVHEMTHQVDAKTGLIAELADLRTAKAVTDSAIAAYRLYGLDTAEVVPIVNATWHRSDSEGTLSHGHTRLAEARLVRELQYRSLRSGEVTEIINIAAPREIDMHLASDMRANYNVAESVRLAGVSGIAIVNRTIEQIAVDLMNRANAAEAKLVAIERRR